MGDGSTVTENTQLTEILGEESGAQPRIHLGTPEYFEIVEFLQDEATLLDDKNVSAWFDLLDEELIYRMPVRVTRPLGDGDEFEGNMCHFDEDKSTVVMKAKRLMSPFAWSENPPSRTRRFVTNVRVFQTEPGTAYRVVSSILVLRYRRDLDIVSAKREDTIVRRPQGLRLKRRMVYSDQTTMLTQNLTFFL
jgi:PAH dioxygenase small subunit